MDLYHITLFIHIVALVVAASVTAVTKLAVGRRTRARTVGEALDWHNTLLSAARVFPMCLVAFLITGGYMLSIAHVAWSSGFVVAGLVGITLLFASGAFLGIKGAALTRMLEQLAKNGVDQPAPKLVPPPRIAALAAINPCLALAVAFDMVTKPASIPVALGILAIGIVLGGVAGARRPTPAVAREASESQHSAPPTARVGT